MLDTHDTPLALEHLYNARDLGGFPAETGKQTLYRRFLRADCPSDLRPEAIRFLKEYPVSLVIDLRGADKAASEPGMLSEGVTVRVIPLIANESEGFGDASLLQSMSKNMGDFYIYMLENCREPLAEVFQLIADWPVRQCILFHCMHGKDRTGLVAALLLKLVGVSDEDISETYAKSFSYLHPIVDRLIEKTPPEYQHVFRSDKINMEIFLDYFNATYNGDVRVYLRQLGLSDENIDSIHDRLMVS